MRRFHWVSMGEAESPEVELTFYNGIQSDGKGYIIIPNFTFKRDDTIILYYSGYNVSQMQLAFGARGSEKGVFYAIENNDFCFFGEFSTAGTRIQSQNISGFNQPNITFKTDVGYSEFAGGVRRRFFINDIGQFSSMPGDVTETITNDLYILTSNVVGSKEADSRFFKGVIHSFSVIASDGVEKLILRPCLRNGIVGMYDSVSKSFFENSGSGLLTLLN